ncbi:sigma-70 family RNA polymerase sigma factor [Sandaracinus amylolyticus]|uniref:sigma-70 family RNA polymerase sigma factor n=1 Tax=Sandaracinus amylolyticus TaxID=927083 RepID=UPI001F019E24|nr:sigma-70 family RNA polymerase sigma factor [Sandaracinus amylolyticus]UJR78773.1 RNA polymerase sigma factor RpoH [Sandaracinus amylolyticus]
MSSLVRTTSQLDRYRHDLRGVEQLDPETERELARRWAAGDEAAGSKLVEASLPFVIRIAKEYRRWGVPLEDLIQQGNLGLLRAAAKYDPSKECRLVTYAVYWIRAEIREYVIRSYRIVRLGTTRTERRALRSFRRTGVDSVEELAARSGMPLARCEKLWPLLSQGDVSLDATYDDQSSALDRLSGIVVSPEEEVARRAEIRGVREVLDDALAKLSDRERRIVEARVLSDEPITLEALGVEMGVSKERVRQLEERACSRLRTALAAYQPMAA